MMSSGVIPLMGSRELAEDENGGEIRKLRYNIYMKSLINLMV